MDKRSITKLAIRPTVTIIVMIVVATILLTNFTCDQDRLCTGGCDKIGISFATYYGCDVYQQLDGIIPCYSYFYMIVASILYLLSFIHSIVSICILRYIHNKKKRESTELTENLLS